MVMDTQSATDGQKTNRFGSYQKKIQDGREQQ
jgi:hypothetical protein